MKRINMRYFHSRRFKFGSLATVITAVFVAAIILINVVAGLLLDRFPISIDLTADNRFELTQDSIDFLAGLEQDVKITVLADEATFENAGVYYKQIYEIIRDYAQHSSRVTVEFRSITKNPGLADDYPSEQLEEGDIIVETDKRYRKIDNGSLVSVTTTSYGTSTYSSQAEQQVTSALMYVTESNITKAALLTGLSSSIDVSGLQELLTSNVYDVISVNLLTEEISSYYQVVILPQPTEDLTSEQVEKINAYLDNDGAFGKSLLFISNGTTPGTVLKTFLADWGIEMQSGTVYEMNESNMYSTTYGGYISGATVADEELASSLNNAELPVISAFATPITTLFESRDNRETSVLLQSSDTSVLVPYDADETFDPSAQSQSAMNLVVEGRKLRSIDGEMVSSNVIAFGSAQMLTTNMLNYGGYGNGDFTITTINEASGKDSVIKILPIDLSYDTITISQTQVVTYAIIFIGVIPLIVLAIGIVVFVRRRHL